MGALVFGLEHALAAPLAAGLVAKVAALAGLVGGGLVGFAALALLLGVADWRDLRRRLRRQAA
jgi:hypothetical protein